MSDFRVVILGAGPAGLFTAVALAAAGIDFIVLEKQPEIKQFKGALLVLWPPFVRVLDQLGLYEQVKELSMRFTTKTNITHNGEPLSSGRVFAAMEDELGYPTLGLSRSNLLRILYENLPGHEEKVREKAHAVNIEKNENGVRVHLADGSVVNGSMVIAADGVHSPTRQLIQRLRGDSPSTGDANSKSEMVATFVSLFGHTRGVRKDIALGDFAESHGPGIATQSTRLDDTMFFTVLKRLDKSTSQKRSYTSKEVDNFAREMSDVSIFPGVKLKEIWPLREQADVVLLHQEEGLAKKWYHDRIVIVGDAAHKMTSINGQGAMSAVLSATELVNSLRAALQKNSNPSTEDLNAAFAKYETLRRETSRGVVDVGMYITRFITWSDQKNEVQDRYISRTQNIAEAAKKMFLMGFTQSPILDFIPFDSKQGSTPWVIDGKQPIRPQL